MQTFELKLVRGVFPWVRLANAQQKPAVWQVSLVVLAWQGVLMAVGALMVSAAWVFWRNLLEVLALLRVPTCSVGMSMGLCLHPFKDSQK